MIQTARETALFLAARLDRNRRGMRPDDLHRLLLLAQSWHLVSYGSELFPEAIIATPTGPVVEGVGAVTALPRFAADVTDVAARAFLDGFCQTYGAADSKAIAQQTDRDDGAWALTRLVAGDGAAMHPDLMRTTFRLMLLDHADAIRRRGSVAPDTAPAGTGDFEGSGENVVAFRRAGKIS